MTRAEGVCACINILDLAESMSERLPDQYFSSLSNKAGSMKTFIKDEWRSTNITEKMDAALRNMWAGLRRWDRQDEHNSDLFDGLPDVIDDFATEAAYEHGGLDQAEGEDTPRGLEEGPEPELSPEQSAALQARSQAAAAQQKPKEKALPLSTTDQRPEPSVSQVQTSLANAKENAISVILTQIEGRRLKVVRVEEIKYGRIEDVMKKTTSDRTHQLILAAFYAGKRAGVSLLDEEFRKLLSDDLR
jgi:hypothetical protein